MSGWEKVSFEEAKNFLSNFGLDIQKDGIDDSSDPAWITCTWEKDGEIVMKSSEDGYFIRGRN